MLAHLPRPEHQHGSRLHNNRGFRLVDLSVLRAALEKAQECPCSRHGGRLSIAEVDPNKVQEDLVTQLALRCSLCNKVRRSSLLFLCVSRYYRRRRRCSFSSLGHNFCYLSVL